jgi:repressor LexA
MMPEPLTKLERRILDYLIDYLRRNTYQPSIREIGRRFDIKSTKTVSEYLQSLADKGWIERDPSRSRGVKLLGINLSPATVSVPWYDGWEAEEAPGGQLDVDRRLAGGTGAFCLTVGRAVAGAYGLAEGDLVLAEPVTAEELEDGDTVLARLGGQLSVRRYFRREGEAVLEPASGDYAPALLRPGTGVVLLGRVVSLIRRLRHPSTTGSALTRAEAVS